MIRRVFPRIFPNSIVNLDLIPPITHPLAWLLVLIVASEFLIPPLLLPIGLGKYIGLAIKLAIPVFGVILAYRVVDILAFTFAGLAGKTETTMDDQLVPLLTKTLKIIVAVFGVIFALQNLGVNVTALLAGVSIGGLALALAAQDTVKNFLGSVSIFLDRPFAIGDFIDAGAFMGVVTEVGVRSTRLRAPDGAQVTVPNGALVNMNITNHGVRTYRRYATSLGLTYDTPREKIEAFVNGARKIAIDHPLSKDDSVIVQFHEMADSSLNVFFAVIYETPAYDKWLEARQEVFLAVMKLAEELEVSFAFPSTSVYLESMPGPMSKEQ